MEKKKQTTVNITMAEYKRLRRLDGREIRMRPLILQLASFMRQKKRVKK